MKYKVKDKIKVAIEIRKDSTKRVSTNKESRKTAIYQILACNEAMQTYMVVIDDDMVGWKVSGFHVKNLKIDPALVGKVFYDISDAHIIEKVK